MFAPRESGKHRSHFDDIPPIDLHQLVITDPLLHRMKILIVDDEQVSADLLHRWLVHHGYTHVQVVTDSRLALETCDQFDPDLILLDLIMPNMDGFAILEELRSGDAGETFLPVVVLTADTSEEAKRRALEAGATDFLHKPLDQTESLLRIHNLLHSRRAHLLLDNRRAALEGAIRERTIELRALRAELQTCHGLSQSPSEV